MPENHSKKQVILILPYLNINTTSAGRFQSFITAFQKQDSIDLEVIQIDYGSTHIYFAGHENENGDDFSQKINNLYLFKPSLNRIQKLGFKYLNKGSFKLWRVFQLLHLFLYRTDIFDPGKLSYHKIFATPINYKTGYVIVSSGHFSYFSAAAALSKELSYKLILDYRDPWTLGYSPIGGLKLIHWIKISISRKTEMKLLDVADLITTVSTTLKSFFPINIKDKVSVIPNGSNFNLDEVTETQSEIFNIVYAGTIYDIQLENDIFFEAFKEFKKDKDTNRLKLHFLGSFYNSKLKRKIKEFDLEDACIITKRLRRVDLLTNLNKASAFLHLRYGKNKGIITSKQADYLVFRKPIILPVSDEGDIAQSILENNAGYVCNTVEENKEVLEILWEKYLRNDNVALYQSEEMLKAYSREKIAVKFVDYVLNLNS